MKSSFSHFAYRLIYTLLLLLLIPLIVLRLVWRSRNQPAYRQRLLERFAWIQSPQAPVRVWLHAVSVGETMAARPLIEALLAEYGERTVFVTSTTLTGSDLVQQLFTDRVQHAYFPYDLPGIVSRYLEHLRPGVFVSMETEIWPNLWHACSRRQIPVILANARLSSRSVRRYQKVQGFISGVLNEATLIACRHSQDARHFRALGAAVNRVRVIGDIKADIQPREEEVRQGQVFRQQWGSERQVLVAASTHETEEATLLDIFRQLQTVVPDILLVMVPRHPERFAEVANLIERQGFFCQKRSAGSHFTPEVEVILGDSMGEMMSWYASADVVFIGGSLIPRGGHNPLEPLSFGVPVVSGSQVFNFQNTFSRLVKLQAAFVVEDKRALEKKLADLLTTAEDRHRAGQRGIRLIEENRGATDRLCSLIVNSVDSFS